MNNDKQIQKYENSFYTLIFEEEDNEELKKNDLKEKNFNCFVTPFYREIISVFHHITFTTFAI